MTRITQEAAVRITIKKRVSPRKNKLNAGKLSQPLIKIQVDTSMPMS
jgi:hypothetical protein